jgi:hypothetical protein
MAGSEFICGLDAYAHVGAAPSKGLDHGRRRDFLGTPMDLCIASEHGAWDPGRLEDAVHFGEGGIEQGP